jgi:competence protein ComEA
MMAVHAPVAAEDYEGSFLLDPNTAPVDSLELLAGIGPVLAHRIVEYRRQHRFEEVEDLTDVPGIGEKTLLSIRHFLKVEKHER